MGPTSPGPAGGFSIRPASPGDVPVILGFIQALAEYERLSREVSATEDRLHETLFGARPAAEVILGEYRGKPVAFALFFQNYSTFLARPGLHLEDLFVLTEFRGRGFGRALLIHLAGIARDRGCGRLEWQVLDWNEPSIGFYRSLGAVPMSDWTTMRVTGGALSRLADGIPEGAD
jgi:GNAT superfamily N-acetyltransferase